MWQDTLTLIFASLVFKIRAMHFLELKKKKNPMLFEMLTCFLSIS